ncbi:DUF3592 domain-containing protein [Zobellia laminariae]|uniref:DUF3592 domain-containing protein n=1 Tax=Zobellia laminariae TaxID=248906 RepID=UPI0026F411DD|nr:DUF3592 domain-containing protein [Zobellia laminariae]WKX76171.1 DUF3592 domain-containing protein [Zobellia laminariae]
MKTSLLFLLSTLLYWPISAQDSSKNWIETEAKITEIHNNIKARGTRSFATVSYTGEDGNPYQSRVELLAIPFVGTLKSVNDTVTVYYDPANPTLAKSPETSFLESYGLYLLIGAGILISLYNFRNKFGGDAT